MSSIAPQKKLRRNPKNLQLVIPKMISTQSENSNNSRHSSEDRTVHGVIKNKDRMNKRPCKTPNPVSDFENNLRHEKQYVGDRIGQNGSRP